MKEIRAADGTVFRVDDADYEWASAVKWHLANGYPAREVKGLVGKSFLHRELMHYPCAIVHHRDGDPLNCQRENLEVVSASAHAHIHERGKGQRERIEAHPGWGASGFKGVSWHKCQQRWSAQISVAGKPYQVGFFATPEEAALAYDAAVIAFRGGRGYKNLIGD